MSKYTLEKEAVANIMFFVPATWSRKSEDARWFARGLRLRLTTCPRVEDIQHAKAEHEPE